MSGGVIAVRSPGGGSSDAGGNVLIGNFALFGATGGRVFVEGEAAIALQFATPAPVLSSKVSETSPAST